MTRRNKTMLSAMLVLDAAILLAAGYWFFHRASHRLAPIQGKTDIRLQVWHPEPTLTQIDLINDGNADAPVREDVNVSWSYADMKDSQALPGFDLSETGRRSLRFQPKPSASPLAPGERRAIGWVRLTDDSPVRAEFADQDAAQTH